jgi:hypothetical protein
MNKQQAELHSQSIRCSNQPRNIKMNKQQAELHRPKHQMFKSTMKYQDEQTTS